MSTYSLSGTGTQALSSNVGALHVHVTTMPSNAGNGVANPANYYGIALIRAGDGTAWFTPKPVDATDTWIGLPVGTTEIGYSFLDGAAANVTEVFGASPLVGSTPSVEQLSDVVITSIANGDVLTWDNATSKWVNHAPSSGSPTLANSLATLAADVSTPTAGTWYDAVSLSLGAGTWLLIGKAILTASSVPTIGEARILSGTSTVVDASECFIGTALQDNPLTSFGVVTLTGTTTVKLQATLNNNSVGAIRAATTTGNSTASISGVTRLLAIQIA